MIRCYPSSLWKLDKKDFILFIFSFLVNVLIILVNCPQIIKNFTDYKSYKFLSYQDSIISIHSAKNIFVVNQETMTPASPFCNPLKLHGIFIQCFISLYSHLFLLLEEKNAAENNLVINQIKVKSALYGQITSIFITSFFVCYVFRRLISIFHICDYQTQKNNFPSARNNNISTSPFLLTILIALLPFRFAFLRSFATSDSLFFGLVCLTLIFYNVSNLISTFLFLLVFLAALATRYEGVLLIPIFIIISVFKIIAFGINKIRNTSVKNDENVDKSDKNIKNANINTPNINSKDKSDDNKNDDKVKNDNDKDKDKNVSNTSSQNENNELGESIIENDLYDIESTKYIVSIILKLVFVLLSSVIYYFVFKNYAERPFSLHDFISHLVFPFQFSDEKASKNPDDAMISYPFSLLLKNVGAISTLRQAHSVFSLFLPLIFVGLLLITTNSSSPLDEKEEELKSKEDQSKKQNESQQKAKIAVKEEKNQPKQKGKPKSNSTKSKNNRNQNKSTSSTEENPKQVPTSSDEKEIQNQESSKSTFDSIFSPFYQKVTADFMRQIGVLVLTFTTFASCFSTGAVFRIVVTAEAFAYPIVAERLVKHFLLLLFSTSTFLSMKQENQENEKEMKKLKMIALSEKIVFIFGSLFLVVALIAWACFYSRRESHRYSFQSSLWYSIVIK